MAFIPVPNTVRISLVFSHEGQTIVNTVHASKSGGPSAGDLAALASSMQGWWVTYLAPYSSQNFCLQQVNVVDLSAADAPSYWLAVSPAECGTVAEEGWTANVAAVISFRSDFRGRNDRCLPDQFAHRCRQYRRRPRHVGICTDDRESLLRERASPGWGDI